MKTKIQKIYRTVYNSIANGDSLKKFRAILVREINECYPRATPKEKFSMYKSALELRNSGDNRKNLERIIKAENLIQRNEGVRARMSGLKEQVKENRDKPDPVIFYLCSHHAHPAEDHKDYENRIYVDRYWLSITEDKYDAEIIKKIKSYIKSNKILTVQEIVKAPVYLISRCYCRHYFIPLTTAEVLGSSLKEIRKSHPEGIMQFKPLNHADREKRFQSKRILASRAIESIDNKKTGNTKTEKWNNATGYCSKLSRKHTRI